jgi:dGTPase
MKTDINQLYSEKRTGVTHASNAADPRTEFQRDFDRIIFSSAFRRLQNKTQVFPLPGSVFVHNRLTHSLEVASVGRSLGSLVGEVIAKKYKADLTEESNSFYRHNLYNVIASACLCHDIGNPAFGHSGEDAIASYFTKNESHLKDRFSPKEWADLVSFEGNANAIRVLTQQQIGKSAGGLKLTCSTLAAIAKYPCESVAKDKNFTYRKKFGFFQSEKETFLQLAAATAMQQNNTEPVIFLRHPFVWLVEAADDICYNIIDFEDAHRLGIVEHRECLDLLRSLVTSVGKDGAAIIDAELNRITDKNDKIAYLRAKCISALTMQAVSIYENGMEAFMDGSYAQSIFDTMKADSADLQAILRFSIDHIYNNRNVVEIENAGYNVMYELLSHFVPPILKEAGERSNAEKKAIKLLPPTFNYDGNPVYQRVMGVLDYVSGMTDNYATDLYKRIKGIEIGMKI